MKDEDIKKVRESGRPAFSPSPSDAAHVRIKGDEPFLTEGDKIVDASLRHARLASEVAAEVAGIEDEGERVVEGRKLLKEKLEAKDVVPEDVSTEKAEKDHDPASGDGRVSKADDRTFNHPQLEPASAHGAGGIDEDDEKVGSSLAATRSAAAQPSVKREKAEKDRKAAERRRKAAEAKEGS